MGNVHGDISVSDDIDCRHAPKQPAKLPNSEFHCPAEGLIAVMRQPVEFVIQRRSDILSLDDMDSIAG